MPSLRKHAISLPSWTNQATLVCFFSLLGFTLGAYFSFYWKRYEWIPFFLILFGAFFFLSAKKGKRILLSFSLSFCLSFVLEILPLAEAKEETSVHQGIVTETKNNYFFFFDGKCRYYVYEKGTERETGDCLAIYGKVGTYKETLYEGHFSFGEYLLTRGIKYSLAAYSITPINEMPIRLRSKEKNFLASFDEDASSLLDSLLFDKKDYSSSFLAKASGLDLIYYLSSSGIYLSLLLRVFETLLKRFFSEEKIRFISLPFLLLLSPFFLFKVGFWRVLLSKAISLAPFKERPDSLGRASLTGLVLCLVDYRMPLRSAFLVGEGLSIASSLTRPVLLRFEGRKRRAFEFLTLRAFLFPLHLKGAYYQPFSLLYEFVFLPLLIPFYLQGWLSFLFMPFTSFLNGYASMIKGVVDFFYKMNVILPFGGGWNVYIGLFYFGLLFFFFYALEIGFFHRLKKISLALLAFLLLRMVPFSSYCSEEVTFINVGQGDAILLRKGSHAILIDTGGTTKFDLGVEVDLNYLYRRKIYCLDAVIATHGDYDHIGAYSSLSKYYPIKRLVTEASSFPLTIGGITLNNLNVYANSYSEENAKSLVLYSRLAGKEWLFMGDAPIEIEKQIVKDNPSLRCDVLKIGHHGSKTSTSRELLELVKPDTAIISVGANNRYGHPDKEVVNLLLSYDITIRRTDLEGTITYFQKMK